jgi:hypothetical protein
LLKNLDLFTQARGARLLIAVGLGGNDLDRHRVLLCSRIGQVQPQNRSVFNLGEQL